MVLPATYCRRIMIFTPFKSFLDLVMWRRQWFTRTWWRGSHLMRLKVLRTFDVSTDSEKQNHFVRILRFFPRGWEHLVVWNCSEREQLQRRTYQRKPLKSETVPQPGVSTMRDSSSCTRKATVPTSTSTRRRFPGYSVITFNNVITEHRDKILWCYTLSCSHVHCVDCHTHHLPSAPRNGFWVLTSAFFGVPAHLLLCKKGFFCEHRPRFLNKGEVQWIHLSDFID